MRLSDQEEKETGRVEAFSDGVFAIAITLLILNLKTPEPAELKGASLIPFLLKQWPTYFAFLMSFLTILVMWVNHHRLFTFIRRTDGRLLFINGLVLLVVTITPFPTSLLATYLMHAGAKSAAQIYAANSIAIAVAFNILWRYATAGDRLLYENADRKTIAIIDKQYSFGMPAYLVAFATSFFSAYLSMGICMLLALFFCFTGSSKAAFVGRTK